VVQEFGLVGRNLVKSRQSIAPTWIVVTSQEKLEEVVSALDSKRVQIAKLQDRFRHRVDLAPSDIREVAAVLGAVFTWTPDALTFLAIFLGSWVLLYGGFEAVRFFFGPEKDDRPDAE
jgi:hypothetical protein